MKFRWCIESAQPLLAGQLARSLRIPPLLAQCLVNRGVTDESSAAAFLEPKLKNLSDPFALPGMEEAVNRLLLARQRAEAVVIFGDYDVDGVTSTTLLLEVLGSLGLKVSHYLPNRRDEGYGLSMEAVAACVERFNPSLLIAVDCGSTSVETISWLNSKSIDVLVLDHHQPSNPLPAARAIVNPLATAVPGSLLPPGGAELCSAGLAFKLAHAIIKRGRQAGLAGAAEYDIRTLLDLVALGTVADVVPLVNENRILVSAGLERLGSTSRVGLAALKTVAQCPAKIGSYEIGYQLAPRLNAAGRLETAEDALSLLRATDRAEADLIASKLNQCNQERQGIERSIIEDAMARLARSFESSNDYVIIEGDPAWHIGVVGIVATRVLQTYYRPTIIFGGDGAQLRGSGRSVVGFDLAGALRECGDLLVRHGGHAMAAGVTIEPSRLDAFRQRLNEVARLSLTAETLRPALRLDGEVGLDEITLLSLQELQRMRPHGNRNPAPQLYARGIKHQRPLLRMGANRQHVKMWVTDGAVTREAVWWGAGEASLPVGMFDLAFEPSINYYNGQSTPQLKVLDWRPSGSGNGTVELQL